MAYHELVLPRFYPILDTETAIRRRLSVPETAREILTAGAAILQFRHKGFFSRDVFAEMMAIAAMCRDHGALLVINDRADIACMASAALHLGQDDLPPSEARRVVPPNAMIGYSTHHQAQASAAAAEPVDYLAFGPIFPTASKQNPDPVVGIEALRRIRTLTSRPLVAIGGITRANARGVLEVGADSVAVIGDLFPERGSIADRTREWLHLLGD